MIKQLSLPELLDALHMLDKELRGTRIVVRAVGGFALAWHSIRVNGMTADITLEKVRNSLIRDAS